MPERISSTNELALRTAPCVVREGRSSCEGPLTDRVLGFQAEFAKAAMPFDWTFTRSELHACSIASICLVAASDRCRSSVARSECSRAV